MNGLRHFALSLLAAATATVALSAPAYAEAAQVGADNATSQHLQSAGGIEVWASTDADGTQVVKTLARALWNFQGRDHYAGIAAEHVWFSPASGESKEADRIYLDIADRLGANWRWKARVGSDGHTVLGSAELRRADWSQSVFVEREIIETEQGLDQRIYYTFVGASTDLPIDDNNTVAVTAGVQKFSGKNERLHLRGRFIHVLKAKAGLSAQLDLRYYHSTKPNEFDYFSPSDFVRVLPILQFRRFTDSGWMYLVAGGMGAQHATGGNWQAARFAQLRVESPRSSHNLDTFLEVSYTNDSISRGPNYDYLMGRVGLTMRF